MKKHIRQLPPWIVSRHLLYLFVFLLLQIVCLAQVNTGSNGSDGAFNPTANTVINMASHPDGIYQYTSVNIPANVTVTFIPNANNTPVTWLVQGNVVISGLVDVRGQSENGNSANVPGKGGPGGGVGGYGGQGSSPLPHRGEGLGGGDASQPGVNAIGGNGSYATVGEARTYYGLLQVAAGLTYGNRYLVPLNAGSGGGGSMGMGGGGGGGAILIASDRTIRVDGAVSADGGAGIGGPPYSGSGSGGGIRLLAPQILGRGGLSALGAACMDKAGDGYVRLDVLDDQFFGTLSGSASRGFNPILIAPANQNVSLAIQSVAGNAVPPNPTGVLITPDVTISSQQANPIPIIFQCANIPLNTPITVVVRPVNGPMVVAGGMNNGGVLASSTGTVSVNMPRGGGIIYAKAVVAVGGGHASLNRGKNTESYAQTGLTADGERFTKMEITAALGGRQEIAWITPSGKRFVLPGE
jgi:hypothetical protein